MKIIHIAKLINKPFSGVCVVVPEHLKNQQEMAEVALLNIADYVVPGVKTQFYYKEGNWNDTVSDEFKRPDLVVFHEVYYFPYIKIAKILRKEGIPYVIVPHGSLTKQSQTVKKWKKYIGNILLFNTFIKKSIGLQCLSEIEQKETIFKSTKFIASNGVYMPYKRKSHFNNDRIKMVFIGRLDLFHKGIDLLIEAVKQQKELLIKHNVSIDIYGPDYMGRHAQIKTMIGQCDIGELVTLHNPIIKAQKEDVLLDADLFIQTSRFEGMPMGILEALSYGLPCFITRGTCLGGIVERYDAGWVAETSVEGIEKELIRVVEERDLIRTKSINAQNLILHNYEWVCIAKNTLKKYINILENKN